MPNPTIEKYKQIAQFRDLISDTIKALKSAKTQTELANALDSKIPEWEATDQEFAEILKDLRGKTYYLDLPHVKGVVTKVCEHLEINLKRVEKDLRKT